MRKLLVGSLAFWKVAIDFYRPKLNPELSKAIAYYMAANLICQDPPDNWERIKIFNKTVYFKPKRTKRLVIYVWSKSAVPANILFDKHAVRAQKFVPLALEALYNNTSLKEAFRYFQKEVERYVRQDRSVQGQVERRSGDPRKARWHQRAAV